MNSSIYNKTLKEITRIGVYGILVEDSKILLTTKIKGPYKGLLDLPGGGIEFGESPKETLQRELQEEVSMNFSEIHFFDNLSFSAEYAEKDNYYKFHHLGLIYLVKSFFFIPDVIPQDPFAWYYVKDLDLETLTPFAREALKSIV